MTRLLDDVLAGLDRVEHGDAGPVHEGEDVGEARQDDLLQSSAR